MAPRSGNPWWQTGVVYQVYPWSYQDSNGDGIGDLPGVISRLDHLVRLGVDAVWLSPFYPSPMADFGYDVADFCDVDPRFGTLADADRLIAGAHERGLRLIVDLVPNHTSIEHPWFAESRSSRNNPKRDWYVWRDGPAAGELPNNWLAVFGGPAWDWEETTSQWYLHSFLPQQPDLNWRNPEVRQAMFDVVRFWLDRGVDGFRVDVAGGIMKDPDLRDNPPNPGGERRLHKRVGAYDSQLHVNDTGHPDVHGVYREMREILDGYEVVDGRPRVIIGEIHQFDLDRWARYFGERDDEMHLPFNFGLLKVPWRGDTVAEHVREIERVTAGVGWPSYVLGNHDEHRVVARLGAGQARVGMLLVLTLRGTPTLYYGDELGHPDVVVPPEREQDPWGLRVPGLGLSRDPARTPMPWSNGPGAGFTSADEPWLPLVENLAEVNVASQAEDPGSMLSLTRALLALRRESGALSLGGYRELAVSEAVVAFERRLDDEVLLVAVNLSSTAHSVGLGEGTGEVVVGTHPARQGQPVQLAQLALGPDEAIVVRPR